MPTTTTAPADYREPRTLTHYQTEYERIGFEAWAKKGNANLDRSRTGTVTGLFDYVDTITQAAWCGWKARAESVL